MLNNNKKELGIKEEIVQDKRDIVNFCQRIIQASSISGNEGEVSNVIFDELHALGYDSVTRDEYGNIVACIKGNKEGSIMFEGHMDVVDIPDPSAWTTDPFSADIRDNRIYGRGTTDMKGALASFIYGLADLISGDRNHVTVYIVCVVYEEIFEGVSFGKVLDTITPDAVVLGEPSDYLVMLGQKGRAEIEIITHGKNAHSSKPECGVNAIELMNIVLTEIKKVKCPYDDVIGQGIMVVTDIISSPYPGASVIPSSTRITIDRRLVLGETQESVLSSIKEVLDPAFKDVDGSYSINITCDSQKTYTGKTIDASRFFPGWAIDSEDKLVQAVKTAFAKQNVDYKTSTYPFCTDGSECAGRRGIKTIGYGPSLTSLAHVVDEYIEIEDLHTCARIYKEIVHNY